MKLIKGGQGRSSEDVQADGCAVLACVLISSLVWLLLWWVFA